ncbi:MAG: metallophosphoesterase, partial [Thermotogae bacterium]|nr:metallophosphoesterase [Thermotogota bacterium]
LSGAWIVGCLCDLKPDYSPNNEWTHGFAFVELFENGHFSVKNHLIQGEEVF